MGSEIGTIIYNENIHQFKKRKGVWALFGERDGEYFCLNVAKTVDVGKEISTDVSWLKDQEHGKPDRDYYNQFAEFQFRYNSEEILQSILYPHIFKEYNDLTFVLVNDKENDMECEKKFAWATHSKFWRNGRPFKSGREDYYNKCCKDILNGIIQKESSKDIKGWIKYIKEEFNY